MKKIAFALSLSLLASSAFAEKPVRFRDVYFCYQAVKNVSGSLDSFVKKNSSTANKKARSWDIRSHVLTIFTGGSYPTVISLNGVNELTPAKEGEIIGKGLANFDTYSMETDSGEAGEWGANVLLEKGFFTGHKKNPYKMIFREGTEEGTKKDTLFYCGLNEGSVWKDVRN